MGVHTGDSITVAPAQTLTDREYQAMRDAAIAVIREIGVETGGSNIQFGVHPHTGRMVVIEMNPRVSRSSALASKATGFPDRENRRQARCRLHARRNSQRHHAQDSGLLRADARLRGRQNSQVAVREISRRRRKPRPADEVGRRSHGHRPHLQRSADEGRARARYRQARRRRKKSSRRF